MPLPRFRNLEPDRRDRLFEAAGEEFAERGFAGASVNRILDRAGLSKGVLYYYFEDKADLFTATLTRAVEHLFDANGLSGGASAVDAWVAGLDAPGYWDALREMSRRSLGMLRSDAWYVRLARSYHRIRQEPDGGGLTEGVEDTGRRLLEALIRRGRALGVVRSDLPLDFLVDCTLALDHAADRWVLHHLDDLDDASLVRHMDARMDLMRDMLAGRREAGES